jgi:N-terminal half of MaoC dehydratase
MSHDYITAEVRAIIGARSEWESTCHPVQESEVRRFFQATMDPHPRYWNEEWAAGSRYGKPVAPPAFPVHAMRRPPGDVRDPLDSMDDPDFDGVSRTMRPGLPSVPVPLGGILNGGYEYEFYSYARVGERIVVRSTYRDIYQREGKAGPMVFVVIEDEYQTSDGRPLLKSVNAQIMR